MKISPREMMLLLGTVAAGLIGGSAILARPKVEEWKETLRKQDQVAAQIKQEQETVAGRKRWEEEYQNLSRMLPQYPADQKMDVHWLSIMDDLAQKHGVNISQRQPGKEEKVGEVYELPITCSDWEGRPDAMAHFLFDLQSEGAMLDIRKLKITPKESRTDDSVKGNFTLYCAYTRVPAGGKK